MDLFIQSMFYNLSCSEISLDNLLIKTNILSLYLTPLCLLRGTRHFFLGETGIIYSGVHANENTTSIKHLHYVTHLYDVNFDRLQGPQHLACFKQCRSITTEIRKNMGLKQQQDIRTEIVGREQISNKNCVLQHVT